MVSEGFQVLSVDLVVAARGVVGFVLESVYEKIYVKMKTIKFFPDLSNWVASEGPRSPFFLSGILPVLPL